MLLLLSLLLQVLLILVAVVAVPSILCFVFGGALFCRMPVVSLFVSLFSLIAKMVDWFQAFACDARTVKLGKVGIDRAPQKNDYTCFTLS